MYVRLNIVPIKRRPKATRHGKAHMYTPRQTLQEEKAVAEAYKAQNGTFYADKTPLRLELHIHRALPASRPKKVARECDTSKPDIDNVLKAVMDGLNGVAYADDAQVVEIQAVKHYRVRQNGDFIDFEVSPIFDRWETDDN